MTIFGVSQQIERETGRLWQKPRILPHHGKPFPNVLQRFKKKKVWKGGPLNYHEASPAPKHEADPCWAEAGAGLDSGATCPFYLEKQSGLSLPSFLATPVVRKVQSKENSPSATCPPPAFPSLFITHLCPCPPQKSVSSGSPAFSGSPNPMDAFQSSPGLTFQRHLTFQHNWQLTAFWNTSFSWLMCLQRTVIYSFSFLPTSWPLLSLPCWLLLLLLKLNGDAPHGSSPSAPSSQVLSFGHMTSYA